MPLLILLLMLLLPPAVGCGVAASEPPPLVPQPLITAGIPLTQFSVEAVSPGGKPFTPGSLLRDDLGDSEVTADLNDSPIHIWIAAPAPDRAEAVYTVGRADGACNPRVSALLEDIADDPSFKDAWITYGVSMIRAGDLSQQQRLGELGRKLADVAAHAECSGQMHLHRLRADGINAASDKMHKLAGKLFQSATQVGRPVLLWHNAADGLPRFVPLTTGADAAPLTINLSLEELQIPTGVMRGLTLDGVTRHMAQLLAQADQVNLVLDLLRPERQYPARIVRRGYHFNAAAISEIRAKIVAARSNIERAIEYEEQAVEAALLLGRAPSSFIRSADSLRQARAENQRALERLDHISSGSGVYDIVFRDVDFTPLQTQAPANALKILRDQQETLGAKLAEAKRVQQKPRSKPIPVLVDALLRGWPASFKSQETTDIYDRWVKARQEKVWVLVEKKLSQAGTSFAGARGSILLSNVMFHVRLSEDNHSVLVTPMYVMSGPGFQVADIGAGVVRYESASAEQNLVPP